MTGRGTSRAGHDRWLVSYADLVTLLFAFFTTMYAASVVDATDARRPSGAEENEEMRAADGNLGIEGVVAVDGLTAVGARLESRLRDDVLRIGADIVREDRGVVVSLPEQATFAVGRAEVTRDAGRLIASVADELGSGGYDLRIEGHTDDTPVRAGRYRSNWELSTARAGAVVAYLIEELAFPPERLSAAGYGEFHPRVPNDSPDNRARNRRIDIVVLAPPAGQAVAR